MEAQFEMDMPRCSNRLMQVQISGILKYFEEEDPFGGDYDNGVDYVPVEEEASDIEFKMKVGVTLKNEKEIMN